MQGAVVAVASRYDHSAAVFALAEVLVGVGYGDHAVIQEEVKVIFRHEGSFADFLKRSIGILKKEFLGLHEVVPIEAVTGRALVVAVPPPI